MSNVDVIVKKFFHKGCDNIELTKEKSEHKTLMEHKVFDNNSKTIFSMNFIFITFSRGYFALSMFTKKSYIPLNFDSYV